MPDHEWFEVNFSYAGWVECTCGFKPNTEEEFNLHNKETQQ